MTLSQVARELGIIPSSCLHVLRELTVGRLVDYEANAKLYRLAAGVLSLGRSLTQQNPFVQAAQPHLSRLSRTFEVGASGQERHGDDDMLVVIASSVVPGDMIAVGERRPLLASASGRLMGAFADFDDAELKRRFAEVGWQNPPQVKLWLEEVRAARGNGYATDEGNFRKGLTAMAAAVPEADGCVRRTISVTAISAQLTSAIRKKLLLAVRGAAAEITTALR